MLNVLIADDNDGMRLVLRKAIEKAGHKVVAEVACGNDAVEKRNPPGRTSFYGH